MFWLRNKKIKFSLPVADPGPLMLGVLDTWTPTVNTCILQTLIAQTSLHIKLCTIEARDPISLYRSPEQLAFWFLRKNLFILFKKANVPDA